MLQAKDNLWSLVSTSPLCWTSLWLYYELAIKILEWGVHIVLDLDIYLYRLVSIINKHNTVQKKPDQLKSGLKSLALSVYTGHRLTTVV